MNHKEKDFKFEELITHIKIEEQNQIQPKGKDANHSLSVTNPVESKNSLRFDRTKGSKGKATNQFHRRRYNNKFKGQGSNPKRFEGKFYACDKYGHQAKDFHEGFGPTSNMSKKNRVQVNITKMSLLQKSQRYAR